MQHCGNRRCLDVPPRMGGDVITHNFLAKPVQTLRSTRARPQRRRPSPRPRQPGVEIYFTRDRLRRASSAAPTLQPNRADERGPRLAAARHSRDNHHSSRPLRCRLGRRAVDQRAFSFRFYCNLGRPPPPASRTLRHSFLLYGGLAPKPRFFLEAENSECCARLPTARITVSSLREAA